VGHGDDDLSEIDQELHDFNPQVLRAEVFRYAFEFSQ